MPKNAKGGEYKSARWGRCKKCFYSHKEKKCPKKRRDRSLMRAYMHPATSIDASLDKVFKS